MKSRNGAKREIGRKGNVANRVGEGNEEGGEERTRTQTTLNEEREVKDG